MSAFDEIRIETARLLLRPPRREDFDAWAELATDEEVMRTLGGVQPRAVAWRNFLFVVGGWHIQGFSPFSVIEKASGCWIGRVGPLQPEGWPGTEVGWTLVRSAWGNGYASEAARGAIDWAFDRLGWDEVVHCIAADNPASQRVAASLGGRPLREAAMPPPYETSKVMLWGQSREDWFARRGKDGK
jgi:RimJ/RimL family protein N-acetyltransferase